jgi:cupin 2 domain-containing protein
MSVKQNLLTGVPMSIPDEIFETIISTPNIKLERIISKGHKSEPDFWYDQN